MSGTVSQQKRQKRVVASISKSNSARNRRDKTNFGSSQIFFLCKPRYLNISGHLSITDCFSSGLDCTTFGKLRIQS
jgi:hypothetical protein